MAGSDSVTNEPTWAGCDKCGHGTWHYCKPVCERCNGTQVIASLKRNEEGEPMELPCPEPSHFIAKVAR